MHMGIVWIKALTLTSGHANVIGHVDRVLAMMAAGVLDPTPLVSRHMHARRGPRGLRGLRPPRGAEDRDAAVSEEGVAEARGAMLARRARRGRLGRRAGRLEGRLQRPRGPGEARHRRRRWPDSSPRPVCSRTAGRFDRAGARSWPSRRWRVETRRRTPARSSRSSRRSRWPTRPTSPGTWAHPRRQHLPSRRGLRPARRDGGARRRRASS